MKNRIPRLLLMTILMAAVCAGAAASAQAQRPGQVEIVPSKFKPVRFSVPNGYMKAPLPGDRSGIRLLDPNRPDAIYLLYPKTGEAPDVLLTALKEMAAESFIHGTLPTLNWTTTTLPPHAKYPAEVGMLYSTTSDDMEIQLAQYSRTMGLTKIVYGYFAMRHRTPKMDDAPFLDNLGMGVPDFDKFERSIREQK